MTILDVLGAKDEMPEQAKKDIDEFCLYFKNVIADIDKGLEDKDALAKAKKHGEEFVYPLRLQAW